MVFFWLTHCVLSWYDNERRLCLFNMNNGNSFLIENSEKLSIYPIHICSLLYSSKIQIRFMIYQIFLWIFFATPQLEFNEEKREKQNERIATFNEQWNNPNAIIVFPIFHIHIYVYRSIHICRYI